MRLGEGQVEESLKGIKSEEDNNDIPRCSHYIIADFNTLQHRYLSTMGISDLVRVMSFWWSLKVDVYGLQIDYVNVAVLLCDGDQDWRSLHDSECTPAVYCLLYTEIPPDLSQVLRLGVVSRHRRYEDREKMTVLGQGATSNMIPSILLYTFT